MRAPFVSFSFVSGMESVRTVQLFGGMASMSLPPRMADVSDFRPVPDHQEIYTDANSDQSVIIEILVRILVSWRHCTLGLCGLIAMCPRSHARLQQWFTTSERVKTWLLVSAMPVAVQCIVTQGVWQSKRGTSCFFTSQHVLSKSERSALARMQLVS